jgi:alcohol dehydrogenase
MSAYDIYMSLKDFILQMPNRVIFGINTITQIGSEVKKLGLKKGVIITDAGIRSAGLVDKVKQPLEKESISVEIYDKVEPEPSIFSVERTLTFVKEKKPDFLIGLGGGSAMDTAKAVSVLVNNPGDPEDYYAGGKKEFERPGIPCIAVPTTSGTGAEVTWDAVVIARDGMKAFFEHQYIRPNLAIVDPVMSSTMPPRLTASTGIDALSHAVESSLTRLTNPITQALALRSISLISNNLRTAVYHGSDMEARYNMSLATLTEALSETNAGDVEAHAIGHLIGSLYKIPHGTACGIALPYVMEYNIVVSVDRLKLIAEAMGEKVNNLSKKEAAYKAVYAVKELISDVGLPTSMKEVGIDKRDIPKLAEQLLTIPTIKVFFDYFTVRTTTKEDAIKLLEKIWEGKIG